MVNKKKYRFRLHQGVQIGLLIGNQKFYKAYLKQELMIIYSKWKINTMSPLEYMDSIIFNMILQYFPGGQINLEKIILDLIISVKTMFLILQATFQNNDKADQFKMDRNIYQNNNNNSLEFFLKIVREIKKTNIAVNLIFITLKKLKILN